MIGELKEHELSNGFASTVRTPGILIADSMGLILTLLKLELEPRGFIVWLALDGDDAIDLYRRHSTEIDLVLLDVQMPGLDGPRTLSALESIDPDVFACFMTESAGAYSEEDLVARGAVCVFKKPFHVAALAQFLQDLVLPASYMASPH